eukprot:TRINITY_DN1643_c0_g1_i1.p1 TRINITY_DN1643_c0_g1~~TRINITY_DN1643_c0_g1_i1.p1  ORF type:complete len:105 (+),score=27.49 TRINITY_DN1643_c0_g1_i1:89-403(+)
MAFWFYAKRSAILAVVVGGIGYASYAFVEKTKPYDNWTRTNIPEPGSEKAELARMEQEARFESLFADVDEETRRKVYKRWGVQPPEEKPKVIKRVILKKKDTDS